MQNEEKESGASSMHSNGHTPGFDGGGGLDLRAGGLVWEGAIWDAGGHAFSRS